MMSYFLEVLMAPRFLKNHPHPSGHDDDLTAQIAGEVRGQGRHDLPADGLPLHGVAFLSLTTPTGT